MNNWYQYMGLNKTALLVMDMQMGILARLPQQGSSMVKKVSEAIDIAREKNILVIFVRVGFQKGMPEISPDNKTFSAYKNKMDDSQLSLFMELHPDLGLTENDIVVDKKRVSAFSGNALEMILRAKGISHLVLCGVATGGVVLSTLREAFDKDYILTVLSDGCADSDEEAHQFLMEKIFPKQTEVMTIDEWKMKT
jgi:nicotinamidase-related amidase